jgi:Ca2+-binding RTX toxin-like protein
MTVQDINHSAIYNIDDNDAGTVPDGQIVDGTVINGTVIDVTATTNYSADTITDVPGVTFDTTASSTATFKATQFGGSGIASDATITGDSHTDTINVTIGSGQTFDGAQLQFSNWTAADKFDVTATSDDVTITGTTGNDTFNMGAFFDSSDTIVGGGGADTLKLSGGNGEFTQIDASMLQGVATIDLSAGSYNLATESGFLASGQSITINGSSLGASNEMYFDASQDTVGKYVIDTGAGYNKITLNDQTDVVHAGSGTTLIYSDGVISNKDQIDGAGFTELVLNGDYSSGFTFGAATIKDVADVALESGHSYKLTLNAANVAAGTSLEVDGSSLGTSDSLTVNGSHVTDGGLVILGGAGKDVLTGGSSMTYSDAFDFFGTGTLNAADRIDGGSGSANILYLNGDYSSGFQFQAATLTNVQNIGLFSGHSYKLTLASGAINDATHALDIDGGALLATDSLVFNGSKESGGNLSIQGGAGNDTLTGGMGDDIITGGGGADHLNGGGGANDQFVYNHVSDSTSSNYDTIVGFNAAGDTINIETGLGGVAAFNTEVTTGLLQTAHFDADLATAIGANQLGAHDAVLFDPSSGNLKGQLFIIIDQNGVAGYQAGQDLVIDITGATNLSHLEPGTVI